VNYKKEEIISCIKNSFKNMQYEIVEQSQLNGLLGAVEMGLSVCNIHEPTFVHLGDMILDMKIEFNRDFLGVQQVLDYSRWCMVSKEGDKFFDKPVIRPATNLALSGLYYLTDTKLFIKCVKQALDIQDPIKGEYQLSQALQLYVSKYPFELKEIKIVDIGTVDDYIKLVNFKLGRHFNNIIKVENKVIKRSKNKKLLTEAYHLMCLKQQTNFNVPAIHFCDIDGEYVKVEMDNLVENTLDYVFVFEKHPLEYWESVFNDAIKILKSTQIFDFDKPNFDLYNTLRERGFSEYNSYVNMLEPIQTLTHGDFNLSNMILRDNKIYCIDPSGRFFHNKYYDIAKLVHSVVYDYHFVKYFLYKSNGNLIFYNNHVSKIKQVFVDILNKNYTLSEIKQIKIITMLLFKTMQPLHSIEEHRKIFEKIHQRLKLEIDSGNYQIMGW
jgi:dTDP-glucose pyrophosphorylase